MQCSCILFLIFYIPLCTCTAGLRCSVVSCLCVLERCFIFPISHHVCAHFYASSCLATDSWMLWCLCMHVQVWIIWNIMSTYAWVCCAASSLPCVCAYVFLNPSQVYHEYDGLFLTPFGFPNTGTLCISLTSPRLNSCQCKINLGSLPVLF